MNTHIIIADTIGQHVNEAKGYQRLLPNVKMIGYKHPDEPEVKYPPHSHGAWCGWLAGVPLDVEATNNRDLDVTMHFVPVFRPNGTPYPEIMVWLMEHIERIHEEYKPDHLVVSRSFGAWDRDDRRIELILGDIHRGWSAKWNKLQENIGFVDVASAGNSDSNDLDTDVAYPQFLMADRTVIVGSCDRKGIPSFFSGDGAGVAGVMWGEHILSPSLDLEWTDWSGTSATCPKVAGIIACRGYSTEEAMEWFKNTDSYPRGYDRPHPKWGWGNREDDWQEYLRGYSIPTAHIVPQISSSIY